MRTICKCCKFDVLKEQYTLVRHVDEKSVPIAKESIGCEDIQTIIRRVGMFSFNLQVKNNKLMSFVGWGNCAA